MGSRNPQRPWTVEASTPEHPAAWRQLSTRASLHMAALAALQHVQTTGEPARVRARYEHTTVLVLCANGPARRRSELTPATFPALAAGERHALDWLPASVTRATVAWSTDRTVSGLQRAPEYVGAAT